MDEETIQSKNSHEKIATIKDDTGDEQKGTAILLRGHKSSQVS